jgi:hypothetical protein
MKHFLSQYVGKNFSSDHINKGEVTEISEDKVDAMCDEVLLEMFNK